MTLRLLAFIFTAFALFLAPLGMASDSGMAMAHATAEMTDMAGHCAGTEQPAEGDQNSKMKMGCTSACAAIPAIQLASVQRSAPERQAAAAFQPRRLTGIPPAHETPPPRFS